MKQKFKTTIPNLVSKAGVRITALSAVVLMAAGSAQAAGVIVNPISGTASTELAAPIFQAGNVSDASDLNGSNEHIAVEGGEGNWLSSNTHSFVNQNWIFVDLGAEYDLSEIRIWNYHEAAPGFSTEGRGVDDYNLWVGSGSAVLPTAGTFSTAGETIAWDKFSSLAGWTNLVTAGNLAVGPASNQTDNTYALAAANTITTSATGVRYIGLDVGSFNHDGGGGNQFVGLGQIQAVTVPEPSSAALIGLGGLALILRRRK